MSSASATIVGSYLSPYVRKVLVCLDLKGVDYRIDPIVPFFGGDQFTKLSPVRRIPVLVDESVTLCDSTVICEYLEERYPNPPIFPATLRERARARWLEEFADTRMGEVFIWRLFNEIVIRRSVWGEKTDEAVVRNTLEVEIPRVLDYLENELPSESSGFFECLGIADIAVAVFFRNAEFAGFSVDAQRWPLVAKFAARTLSHPSFLKLRRFEDLLLETPIGRHRDALAAAGAPLSSTTLGTGSPRRGILSTSSGSGSASQRAGRDT
jgi:glutathione S-transferase